jgi:hypothetical protein
VNATLCISEIRQDYQNWTVSNQLTDVEKGLKVMGLRISRGV